MRDHRLVLPLLGGMLAFCLIAATATPARAQAPPKMKMTTDIPAEITTPDTVETPIGIPVPDPIPLLSPSSPCFCYSYQASLLCEQNTLTFYASCVL
jgi:hypothetical protein